MPRGLLPALLLVVFAVFCAGIPPRASAEPARDPHAAIFTLNLAVDATVIGTSAALGLALPVFGDSLVTPSCPCDPNTVNALDRGVIGNSSRAAVTISDVTSVVAVAAPIGLDLIALGASRAFVEDAVVFGETVLVSNALANVAKLAVQRPRPEVYATTDHALLDSTSGYLSFYSGHTTMTFAALSAASMILHLRYGQTVWPWIATALIGSSVGMERVLAGKHFVTDVAVGAATGIAEGILIPYLHLQRSDAVLRGVSLVPTPTGAALVLRRAF